MFDRPAVSDEQIVAAIEERYGLRIIALEFLALGHDAHAWTFRAATSGGDALFVKVRRRIDLARLRLARFLDDAGFDAIVAPLPTTGAALSVPIDGLHLVVYPFVEGSLAAEVGLSDAQWIEYGRIVAALHLTRLGPELTQALPREAFVPAWTEAFRRLDERIADFTGDDPGRGDLVAFWRQHRDRIIHLTGRTEALGSLLRQTLDEAGGHAPGFVLCHGDIHTHNLLAEPGGRLRVIDWDEALLAPRERDLMFVVGSPIGLAPGERERAHFEAGYGRFDIDPVRLAYYHLDWACQDLSGYAEQVMLDDISAESRGYALRIFRGLFAPADEVEVAERFDRALGAQGR
jgi:spectinomycin phosphotransferase